MARARIAGIPRRPRHRGSHARAGRDGRDPVAARGDGVDRRCVRPQARRRRLGHRCGTAARPGRGRRGERAGRAIAVSPDADRRGALGARRTERASASRPRSGVDVAIPRRLSGDSRGAHGVALDRRRDPLADRGGRGRCRVRRAARARARDAGQDRAVVAPAPVRATGLAARRRDARGGDRATQGPGFAPRPTRPVVARATRPRRLSASLRVAVAGTHVRARTDGRPSGDRRACRHEPDLGLLVVLQHRELGQRPLGDVGRSTRRHVARRHERRRRRSMLRRGTSRDRSASRRHRGPRRLGRFHVPRDRRSRRGRRVAAGPSGPLSRGRRAAGCAVPRHLLRRDLSRRRDEGLRIELLSPVQGIRKADRRDSRQSRLVRRARRLRRELLRARDGARRAHGEGRRGSQAHDHDALPDRRPDRARRIPPRRVRGAHGAATRNRLRDRQRRLRAHRRRYRHRPRDRRRAAGVARRCARPREGEVRDGARRPSPLRRRRAPGEGRRLRGASGTVGEARRSARHGRRHA